MNARADSFDMVNYSMGECDITECCKSHYEKCKYCTLLETTGHYISNGKYYYNIYYSEGETNDKQNKRNVL